MSSVSWKYDVVAVLKLLLENLNDAHKPMVNCTMSKYLVHECKSRAYRRPS
jgi:hypothetical protein